MIVGKGSLTLRTYEVAGKHPTPQPDRLLERLEKFAFAGLGSAEEGSAAGWVGPEHLFDGGFTREKVLRGHYAVFALRIDTRKVPGPLLAAHLAMEIAATLEAEGLERLGASRKRELKDGLRRRLLEELPPSQRAYGVFWNLKKKRLHIQSTSKTVNEAFRGLFERTFELELVPQGPGAVATVWAKENKLLEALSDARPLQLVPAPAGSAGVAKKERRVAMAAAGQ